jgi:hypothetical protein
LRAHPAINLRLNHFAEGLQVRTDAGQSHDLVRAHAAA